MNNADIHINDLFLWCNDINAVREFYSNILGFEEESFEPDASKYGHKWVSYQLGNNQKFVFNSKSSKLEVESKWTFQPSSGIKEGIEKLSWTLEMSKEHFDGVVERLYDSEYKSYQSEPQDRSGYTALTVMDPMGNTIDLYYLS